MVKFTLRPVGMDPKKKVAHNKQWCIYIEQEYDWQKANNITRFICSYLKCDCWQENDHKRLGYEKFKKW